jgi:hypothetical protein
MTFVDESNPSLEISVSWTFVTNASHGRRSLCCDGVFRYRGSCRDYGWTQRDVDQMLRAGKNGGHDLPCLVVMESAIADDRDERCLNVAHQ